MPASVIVRPALGGLAADTDEPMSPEMQEHIRSNWRKIEASVPGVRFNYAFWEQCQPRRATYAACRAVIAARLQGGQFERAMISAIQRAYYRQARNPSENETLLELASELGLDERFERDFYSEGVARQLQQEISLCRAMFVESFPSLVLQVGQSCYPVSIDYLDYRPMLNFILQQLEEAK
jgi:putative protein-disulfide isomerase